MPELGRVRTFDTGRFGDAQSDRWGYNQSSVLDFTGRHVLPIWRILKADNKFQQYSFEHIAFHVLGQRSVLPSGDTRSKGPFLTDSLSRSVPRWSHRTLSDWYQSEDPSKIARVFHYYRNRVEMDVEMLDAAEIVDQSWYVRLSGSLGCQVWLSGFTHSESARVFGVDFHSVRTRGSQFKVESVMFKISKPESFMLLSPNRVQVREAEPVATLPTSLISRSTGRAPERRRVPATHHGAAERVLQRTFAGHGLPVPVPFRHDRVQLLLLVRPSCRHGIASRADASACPLRSERASDASAPLRARTSSA